MKSKWLAPILPYLAAWAGLFVFKNAWATLIGFHIAILLALIFLRPALPLDIFFKTTKHRYVFLSMLFCVSGGLGLYLLRDMFGVAENLQTQLASIGLSGSAWFGFIAYFALVNPFFEEYFWRGVLGSVTKQFYIGDLIYAGYHILVVWNKTHPLSMLFMLFVLTLTGWFWRQLYRRDGSLLAPVLGHMVADLSILLAVYRMTMSF
ncbi:MAG: CPBP family intramembrane metalloprotease [Chloroflexi bacterium]|nr:CPBP family intramembrane metalloprotease [Chloroflexota bacterium]MBI3167283.1 CPBP family intramembrane metalloprotease [Chloroflexota bacterium]